MCPVGLMSDLFSECFLKGVFWHSSIQLVLLLVERIICFSAVMSAGVSSVGIFELLFSLACYPGFVLFACWSFFRGGAFGLLWYLFGHCEFLNFFVAPFGGRCIAWRVLCVASLLVSFFFNTQFSFVFWLWLFSLAVLHVIVRISKSLKA